MINIKQTFLDLTSKVYPHGTEHKVIAILKDFTFERDNFGNYYIIVKNKDGKFSDTMFTSHLDTVDSDVYRYVDTVKHTFEDDMIKTNGYKNLGADDKAGVVLMLNMISENIPGLYYFFIGEEEGRIGSSKLSLAFRRMVDDGLLPKINRCISFDRRGYDMITTHQKNVECCSDKFAKELSKKLNEYGFWYSPNRSAGRTDSFEFIYLIPECTNISVGYFNEHTIFEMQDIEFLELLSRVVLKIDWDILPVSRKISSYYQEKDEKTIKTEDPPKNNNVKISSGKESIFMKHDDSEFDRWYREQTVKNIFE